jgi:hypothetical protein
MSENLIIILILSSNLGVNKKCEEKSHKNLTFLRAFFIRFLNLMTAKSE